MTSKDERLELPEVLPAAPAAEADEPVPPTLQVLLAEFVELENKRRELNDQLDIILERTKVIQPQLIDMFADTGIKNARVGKLTVFIKMNKWCSKKSEVSTEEVCKVLKECGLGYMVTDGYNPSSLKAKMTEYDVAEVEPPASLAAVLNRGETPQLATRKV